MDKSSKPVWQSTRETLDQISLARHYNYDGICLYSAKYIMKNIKGLKSDLQRTLFSEIVLPPVHRHSNLPRPKTPKLRSQNQGYMDKVVVQASDSLTHKFVFGFETVQNNFTIVEINHTGIFNFKRQRYYKYFVCAMNSSKMLSEKVYL